VFGSLHRGQPLSDEECAAARMRLSALTATAAGWVPIVEQPLPCAPAREPPIPPDGSSPLPSSLLSPEDVSASPPPDLMDLARPPDPAEALFSSDAARRLRPAQPVAQSGDDLLEKPRSGIPEEVAPASPDGAPAPISADTQLASDVERTPSPGALEVGEGCAPTLGSLVRSAIIDRLPPALRGGRIDPGRHGAWAIAAVAVVAATVAVVLLLRSSSAPVAAPATVSTAKPAAAKSSAGAQVTVDVAGKVRHRGLATLPKGSRVADAIRAAGGPATAKALGRLNLARKVTDGEQILVGVSPARAPGSAGTAAAGVSLNRANAEQLATLPGIGEVLAQRIVDYRTKHGSFTHVDQLREVSGVGEKTYEALKDKIQL
jgi:competence protein ComEA